MVLHYIDTVALKYGFTLNIHGSTTACVSRQSENRAKLFY